MDKAENHLWAKIIHINMHIFKQNRTFFFYCYIYCLPIKCKRGDDNLNTIEETIKMAGFGKKKVTAKQIQYYEDKLSNEGENLLAVCISTKDSSQLYVSDKQVHVNIIKGIFSNDELSLPISSVSSILIKKKFVHADIEIVGPGTKIILHEVPVHIADEIKKIIEHLKLDATKNTGLTYKTDTFELADELRELKDLLEEGLLTQEEFDSKKKQLLGT